jgi:hypothetical protein
VVAGAGFGEVCDAGGNVELDGEVCAGGGGVVAGAEAGEAGVEAPGCAAFWSVLSLRPVQPARASRLAVRTVVA